MMEILELLLRASIFMIINILIIIIATNGIFYLFKKIGRIIKLLK